MKRSIPMRNPATRCLGLFLAGVMLLTTTACNEQAALNDVEKFAPVITGVLTIACDFTASPLCAAGSALLNATEAKVFSLWQTYLNKKAAGTATAEDWNALDAVFQTFEDQSADVFSLAHVVNGAHQQEVLDAANAAQALLAVIEAEFPTPPATVATASLASRSTRLRASLPPPNAKTGQYDKKWLNDWQEHWNGLPAVKARKQQIKSGFWHGLKAGFASAADGLGNAIGEAQFGG